MVIEKGKTRTRLALGVLLGRDVAERADPKLLEWIEERPQQLRQAVRVLWQASGGPVTAPRPEPSPEPETGLFTPVLVEAAAAESTVDWRGKTVLVLGDGAGVAIAVDAALRAAGARTECVTLRETVRMRVDERAGRGLVRRTSAKPARRSVPPPPTSGIPSARHSGTVTWAAASQESTETRSRRPPTARTIAAISRMALPNSASLTDPEVSTITEMRGGLRRRLGRTTPGRPADLREGLP